MLSGPAVPTQVLILLPGYLLLNGYLDTQLPVDRPNQWCICCTLRIPCVAHVTAKLESLLSSLQDGYVFLLILPKLTNLRIIH